MSGFESKRDTVPDQKQEPDPFSLDSLALDETENDETENQEPNAFGVIFGLADDENQMESAFNKYFDIVVALKKSLPIDTSPDIQEQKIKEMLDNQTDIFELVRAYLYKLDEIQRFTTLDEKIGPSMILDDEINQFTKQLVSGLFAKQLTLLTCSST